MPYLTRGMGLESANAITFTPRMLQTKIPPKLKISLKSVGPLQSFEDVKDDLIQEIHHLDDRHKFHHKSDE